MDLCQHYKKYFSWLNIFKLQGCWDNRCKCVYISPATAIRVSSVLPLVFFTVFFHYKPGFLWHVWTAQEKRRRHHWYGDRYKLDDFSNANLRSSIRTLVSLLFASSLFSFFLVSLWPDAQPPVGSIPQREQTRRAGSEEGRRRGKGREWEKEPQRVSLYRVMLYICDLAVGARCNFFSKLFVAFQPFAHLVINQPFCL